MTPLSRPFVNLLELDQQNFIPQLFTSTSRQINYSPWCNNGYGDEKYYRGISTWFIIKRECRFYSARMTLPSPGVFHDGLKRRFIRILHRPPALCLSNPMLRRIGPGCLVKRVKCRPRDIEISHVRHGVHCSGPTGTPTRLPPGQFHPRRHIDLLRDVVILEPIYGASMRVDTNGPERSRNT